MEMSAATAVGAATWKSCEYEVFINHRGPDVKKTFVAHLYAALSSYGIRPFLDAVDIGYALPVFEEIDKALRGAFVHVAIFSKGYAESIYCLEELCAMLESKRRIIPVFYDVEAGNLRRPEDGPYKDAFEKHRKHERTKKIPIWKEALHKVADYRAFRMDEVNGNEHELISRIVVEVQNALPPDLLPGRRIGLEESKKDVVKTLESVSVIGLFGMGGIGKTTLAMEVYNHFVSCKRFDCYCFVKDVRSSQTSVLQNYVLRVLGIGIEWHCNDQRDYTRRLGVALKDQSVLVIVDDISDSNQFKALIPEINELGLKSRIVITSRAQDVLKDAMKTLPASSKAVYEVKTLDKSYSHCLFNMHAFGSETPSEGFVELAETISDACDGLPLALTVMGSYLFEEKDKEIWVESVKMLKENGDIMDKDVRSSQTSVLQNNVLRDLGNADESHCNDERDYTRKLRVALKDGSVLVIVDDISDSNQFKALVPEISEVGLKSRIVITSRAGDVLKDAMKTLPASSKAVYIVKKLDKSYSQRLFNIHAFGSETPSEGFVELAETISDACDGLPLALTVMGSYLFDKKEPEDKEIWVESVKVLQGNTEIIDQLRICYDGLPTDGDRAMFQDIACMLIGVKQEVAMIIWKSCRNCSCSCSKTAASSLRTLKDRSLVKLDKDDTLRMHDVLRDMGRKIVETDGKKEGRQPAKK